MRGADEGHPNRDQSPRDHDARDPAPRTPALDDESAGNFQNDIAEGEDAGPEADHAIVEAEIGRHLQGGGGEIVAIEVGNDVKQEQIRQKTQGNPAAGAAGNVIGDNDWGWQFFSARNRLTGSARNPENQVVVQLRKKTLHPLSFRSQIYRRGIRLLPAPKQQIPRATRPRFGMTTYLGIFKLRHYYYRELRDYIPDPRGC